MDIEEGLKRIDVASCGYVYSPEKMTDFEKHFVSRNQDDKLLALSTDKLGMISDCYILYAISILGVCDRESIQNMLGVFSSKKPDIYVCDYTDPEVVRSRLQALTKMGFVYSVMYTYLGESQDTHYALYTCSKDAIAFVRRRFDRSFRATDWVQAFSEYKLLSFAAASKLTSKLCQLRSFEQVESGSFFNKYIRDIQVFPAEISYENAGKKAICCVLDGLKEIDTRLETKKEYEAYILEKLNFIRCYLLYRSSKYVSYIVISVLNEKLAKELLKYMYLLELDAKDFERIYVSGLGMLDLDNLENSFLSIKKEGNRLKYIRLSPPFLLI